MRFDEIISREGTYSEKYDLKEEKFQRSDILPLWVADMDFEVSDAITNALQTRIRHPIYGYTTYSKEYFDSIQRWMQTAHDFPIQKEWIVPIFSIVTALNLCVTALTKEKDAVLIQPPIYPPFFSAIKRNKRTVLENQLVLKDGKYEIDFEDFEKKAKKAKLFLFCSPHNPTGRVWEREELEKIAKICKQNGVIIISDEVHADLVYEGFYHIPIAKIDEAKDITITLNAPSKSFNIAGIVRAYAIVQNSSLRRRFFEVFQRLNLAEASLISQCATIAAYKQSDLWLKELKEYLYGNLLYLYERFKTMAKIKPLNMQSTFLLWLDCTELCKSGDDLHRWFIDEARLGLNPGFSFSLKSDKFMRLNFAVPRSCLIEAMQRLEKAYKELLLDTNNLL